MARFPNRFLHLIEAPGSVDNYKLFRMNGTESISEPFRFELTIRSQGAIPRAEAWIGASITFTFGQTDEAERKINGRCSSFHHLHEKGSYVEFEITIEPAFEALKLTRNRRIFNDKSAKQVIEQVLGEHQVSFDDGKYGTSPTRPYIVQHDESDFALVSRLMEDEGIYYYFKFDEGAAPYKHRMIVAGDPSGYYDGEPFDVAFRRDHLERGLSGLQMGYASAPAKVVTHDYNYKQPGSLTPVTAPSRLNWAQKNGQIFQWGAGYKDPGAGQQRADLRVQGEESGAVSLKGNGTYSAFAPGARFNVNDQRLQPWERRVVVRGVRHSAFDPFSSDEGEPYYDQQFEAHPSAQVFRPARGTPRAISPGPQTAIVLDQNDGEGLGRVKVRFHWDQDGHSTCWVRVLQQWGGDQIGAQFIPRPGMEVLVDFIDGRADHPVVIGCLYNGKNKQGFALPANLTQQGWRSSGDGGKTHHLLFEDKGGGEKIDLLSGRDFVRTVGRNESAAIQEQLAITAKAIDIAATDSITLHVGGSKVTITGGGVWINGTKVSLNGGDAPPTFTPDITPAIAAAPAPATVGPAGALAAGPGGKPGSGSAGGSGGSAAQGGTGGGGPQSINNALGKDGSALAAKSPSLTKDISTLDKNGWQMTYGKPGGGSFADRRAKLITIDPNQKASAPALIQTVSHEVGHATYTGTPDVSSRAAFVQSSLADEGAATLSNVRTQREILAQGGSDIGIAGNSANQKAYNAAYDTFLKDKDAGKARNTIGSIFGNGEKTSNTGQTYTDYYGSFYDKAYPPKK